MRKLLELNVFDAFWINCQANNVMTVLTTIDDSYIMAGAGNHFIYEMEGRSGWFKAPTVTYGDELERALHKVLRRPYRFENNDIVNELIMAIKSDRLISIEIDLFDWNPLSINYHRNHVNHMTLCIGFDEEKHELYFDDAAKGQKMLVKKYEEFLSSVVLHDGIPDALETIAPKSLEHYEYEYDTIRRQAARLVNNISLLRYQTYFSTFEQPHDINIPINSITKVYNRQLANKEMLVRLRLDGHISEEKFRNLAETADSLIFQWDLIKNRAMKMAMSDKPHDFTSLDKRADTAFLVEQNFWSEIAAGFSVETPKISSLSKEYTSLTPVSALVVDGDDIKRVQKPRSDIILERIELSLDEDSDYFTNIKLIYSNVSGSLSSKSDVPYIVKSVSMAFEQENYISNVAFNGNTACIKTEFPFTDIAGLWHYVLLSAADVTDSAGNVCPDIYCVGPGERKVLSPYINLLECSKPVSCKDIASEPYPTDKVFVNRSFFDWECGISSLYDKDDPEKDSVFCRSRFTAKENSEMRLWLGHQESVKLWFNGEELGSLPAKRSPPHRDPCCIDITVREGQNEIMVLYSTAHGTARGIMLRLEMREEPCYDGNKVDRFLRKFPEFMGHGSIKEKAIR